VRKHSEIISETQRKPKWEKVKHAVGLWRYKPSGQYFARVRYRGKLHRRKLGTTDYEFAKRKLADFRRTLERVDSTKGKTSFAVVLDDYSKTLTGAQNTLRDKAKLVEKLQTTLFGCCTLPLRELRPSQFESWLAQNFGGMSASYYNGALMLVRDALQFAVRERVIAENPIAHLKCKKRKDPIRLTPSFEQFNAVVADIRAQQFNHVGQASGDFIEFLGLAGLGQAEAAALTPSHVDLAAGQIVIKRKKTGSVFHVPIYPQLRPLLERLCTGKRHDERLFKVNGSHRALINACKRLGFPLFTQRSLRRMFITRAIERGVDVKVIAEWQGHRDGGRLILQTYSHVRPEHSNRMAQLMTTDQPENVVPMTKAQP
jgi:integrase